MFWHIELKFYIWLCLTVLQITFECCQFASIFVGVMPLSGLRILEIPLYTCIAKFRWNLKFHVGFFNAFFLRFRKVLYKNSLLKCSRRAYYAPFAVLRYIYLIARGFHRTFATGAACQKRKFTPPDTWSCPTLGLASILILRTISPWLVLFPDFWVSNVPRYLCFFAFNFHITNFQFLSSNIPASPAYGAFISQLIRHARACSSYGCFIQRAAWLLNKLLEQGCAKERLKLSLKKLYSRYGGFIKQFEVPL